MTDQLTQIENASIRDFVAHAAEAGYLKGRVLDYGCGRQPYRLIVEANGGEYHGYDQARHPGNVSGEDIGLSEFMSGLYDSALCTQVLQYVPEPRDVLIMLMAKVEGHLVLTYPTNWPEVQDVDLHRFTKAGMERLLTEAGFTIIEHVRREVFYGIDNIKMIGDLFPYEFALGYGVIARA